MLCSRMLAQHTLIKKGKIFLSVDLVWDLYFAIYFLSIYPTHLKSLLYRSDVLLDAEMLPVKISFIFFRDRFMIAEITEEGATPKTKGWSCAVNAWEVCATFFFTYSAVCIARINCILIVLPTCLHFDLFFNLWFYNFQALTECILWSNNAFLLFRFI